MKRRLLFVVSLIVLVLALVACGGRGTSSDAATSEIAPMPAVEYYSEGSEGFAAPEAPVAEYQMAVEESAYVADTANLAAASVERLIIRTADMSVVVTDTEEAMTRITQMAEGAGGWVVSSNVYQASETAKSGYLTVRIPAEGFQSFLDAVSGLSVEVTNLSTSGQDVTEEYVDLESQLTNLEATAERVRGFLDEARNTEDALAVSAELSRLEGEIQVIKGRMQYLDQSSAFSAVSINLTPDELAQPIETGGWQPQGIIKDAVEALIQAMQSLGSLAIWFAVFLLPILLVIAVPVLLVVYLIRKRRAAKRAAAAAKPEAPAE